MSEVAVAEAKRGCLGVLTRLLAVLLVLALLAAGAVAWLWQDHARFAQTPLSTPAPSVVVAPGDSVRGVLRKLRAAGVDAGHDWNWLLLARQVGAAGHIKVGEYALQPPLSPRELLEHMRDGRVIQYRLTIVEGWNIRQVRAALNAATPLQHLSTDLDDAALMAKLGFPGQHPEGRFLPETYLYQRGDSDLDVLTRAHKAMAATLDAAWARRADNLPLRNADEALILASIIEKETALAEERPKIAGVFVRRLQQGMKLQTDPSVIYGIGSRYDGNIRRRDLETDTPYNTYTRTGLTPTPIAMPGRAAIEAAVQPAPGQALYFVAVGDGSGAHVFSDDYAAHSAAVARYLQRSRAPVEPVPTP